MESRFLMICTTSQKQFVTDAHFLPIPLKEFLWQHLKQMLQELIYQLQTDDWNVIRVSLKVW